MGIQKLLCGNCLQYMDSILQEIHSLNKTPVIVADPPFNIGYHYNRYCDRLSDKEYWDMLRDIFLGRKAVVIHYPEKLHRLSWELATEPTKVISWVYNSNTRKQHRDIAFYDIAPDMTQVRQPYKNPNDKRIKQRIADGHAGAPIYDWWNVNQVKNTSMEKTEHPCQMPLQVMKNIIGILPNRKDIAVIDPFMGSGTTGVACGYYDIDFYGIELDKTYFDIASQRIFRRDKRLKIWGLFDSGNSCYKQGLKSYVDKWGGQHEITSIGLDIKGNTDGFVNLDLSTNCLFNKKALWQHLDRLPKPDLILASPPCESWSTASAMKHGNACWVNKANVITTQDNYTFNTERFVIRNYNDYENTMYKFNNQFYKRINGELTIYNTIEIIKRYQPKIWVIENPAFGRIWSYIENVIGFSLPYKNLTYYSAYGYPVVKPTRFSSNIDLELKQEAKRTGLRWSDFSSNYNTRSNIPLNLIEDIYHKCESYIKEQ